MRRLFQRDLIFASPFPPTSPNVLPPIFPFLISPPPLPLYSPPPSKKTRGCTGFFSRQRDTENCVAALAFFGARAKMNTSAVGCPFLTKALHNQDHGSPKEDPSSSNGTGNSKDRISSKKLARTSLLPECFRNASDQALPDCSESPLPNFNQFSVYSQPASRG